MSNTHESSEPNASAGMESNPDIKAATQELLKYGLLEADRKPNLYRIALTYRLEIGSILEPLDFELQVDEVRGLLFLSMREQAGAGNLEQNLVDERTHPLVRRQRLTLEQSLLIAILRQHYLIFEQEGGVGSGNASISIEEATASFQVYLESTGSDARDEKRIRVLLENLRGHSIVTEVDEHNRVGIRPLITHVANPASLAALLSHFQSLAGRVANRNINES
jgi:hypothetical protein